MLDTKYEHTLTASVERHVYDPENRKSHEIFLRVKYFTTDPLINTKIFRRFCNGKRRDTSEILEGPFIGMGAVNKSLKDIINSATNSIRAQILIAHDKVTINLNEYL